MSSAALDFNTLMETYEVPLRRYTTRILKDQDAAKDVVQNTFLKYHQHFAENGAPCKEPSGWLYRVAHNQAVDYIRKESRRRELREQHFDENPPRDARDRSRERRERLELILDLVDELNQAERDVLILRLRDGKSYREISELTGRSEGNVGCLLHHAVKYLSQRLQVLGLK